VKPAIAIFALSLLAACEGRPQSASSRPKQPRSGPKLVVLDFTQGVPEVEQASFFAGGSHKRTHQVLLTRLGVLRKESDVRSIFIRLGSAEIPLARAQEIGEALESIRKETKITIGCHADALSNATAYLFARGCSKIWVSPAGEVATVGIAAQIVYLRKLLADELHLSIDILQVGRFKGAEEPLTRDGPSDEARESLESVLTSLRKTWLDGVREGRGKPEAAVAAEDGPFSPQAAKDRGLIDAIGYADDAREETKKESGAVREETRFGPGSSEEVEGGLDELLKSMSGGEDASASVALIRASGSISMGDGESLFGDEGITEKGLGKQIDAAAKAENIKAVVLRIDSPGGSALASDLLWHRLMNLRKKKPLVVSVGSMAASGGYYLASTGQEIYADDASIVGSIGVVGGKIAVGDALERIGVHAETFAANKEDPNAKYRAAYESPLVGWDEATKKRVYESMEAVYRLFLQRVAEGRQTTVDKIEPHAEGRIFSGDEGKRRGLVDRIGGVSAAIARARELAKLPQDARVILYTSKPKILELVGGGDDDPGDPSAGSPAVPRARSTSMELVRTLVPELVPFAESYVPLLRGERTLAVLPYALSLR
jgi:protease-4